MAQRVKGEGSNAGPRAGLVELINCFCSALGISFNIQQPVMKESSELSLNIDGPGRFTAGLGRLPPARAPPQPRRASQLAKIRLAFPGKPPCARQGGQAPRSQRERRTPACCQPAKARMQQGSCQARREPSHMPGGVGTAWSPGEGKAGGSIAAVTHNSARLQRASSLHQLTLPAAAKHLAPSFPDNKNLHGQNQSENFRWAAPELAGSRWPHNPLSYLQANRQGNASPQTQRRRCQSQHQSHP